VAAGLQDPGRRSLFARAPACVARRNPGGRQRGDQRRPYAGQHREVRERLRCLRPAKAGNLDGELIFGSCPIRFRILNEFHVVPLGTRTPTTILIRIILEIRGARVSLLIAAFVSYRNVAMTEFTSFAVAPKVRQQ